MSVRPYIKVSTHKLPRQRVRNEQTAVRNLYTTGSTQSTLESRWHNSLPGLISVLPHGRASPRAAAPHVTTCTDGSRWLTSLLTNARTGFRPVDATSATAAKTEIPHALVESDARRCSRQVCGTRRRVSSGRTYVCHVAGTWRSDTRRYGAAWVENWRRYLALDGSDGGGNIGWNWRYFLTAGVDRNSIWTRTAGRSIFIQLLTSTQQNW